MVVTIPTRNEIAEFSGRLHEMHRALASARNDLAGVTGDLNQMKNSLANAARNELIAERDKLRADLDRANTEAALARDARNAMEADRDAYKEELGDHIDARTRAFEAGYITSGETMEDAVRRLVGERDALAKATTDTRAKAQNELRSIERALCSADVLNKFAALSRGTYECHVKNTIETAISALRDDAATTPYSPPFEGNPKDCAFKTSKEITEAVALMRRADGKALLRELRAWVSEQNYNGGFGTVIQASRILAAIDRLLSLDLDRVDPKPAPVDQPAAAVPDDTRELVAQLGEVLARACELQDMPKTAMLTEPIIAKLRGGA